MSDNFDTNIAKRKPNITRKTRPIHPWHVQKDSSPDNNDLNKNIYKGNTNDDFNDHETTINSKPIKKTEISRKKYPNISNKPVSQKSSDLSDSINIHSNYCKLDNDISDKLFSVLSPSAQSVYLRLYRQSFGWNRNWAAESLPKLTKACNLSIQTIRKAIKELITYGCIKKEISDYHKATVYRIFLPSEIGFCNNTHSNIAGLNIDSQNNTMQILDSQNSISKYSSSQNINGNSSYNGDLNNFEGKHTNIRGIDSSIQSVYFSGTTIYTLIESGGALPKNISKYINDKHLLNAVETIDEFYDSIGFSIVSRALYRKSLVDYFELIKSGFSADDIRYAVRWTFNNARSRPESFSLIKHTMHLAMDDLINNLKNVSGEKDLAEKKRETLLKNFEWENKKQTKNVSGDDLKTWLEVIEDLKGELNDHSFRAFIEPLKLVAVKDTSVFLSAPPDSVSWIVDHYVGNIEESYREKTGENIIVKFE